jgi:hypothetical protein
LTRQEEAKAAKKNSKQPNNNYLVLSDRKPIQQSEEFSENNKEFSQYLANAGKKVNLTTSGSNYESTDLYNRLTVGDQMGMVTLDEDLDKNNSIKVGQPTHLGEYFMDLSKTKSVKVLKTEKLLNMREPIQECDSLENSNEDRFARLMLKNRVRDKDYFDHFGSDIEGYINPDILAQMKHIKYKLKTVMAAFNKSHLQMKKALENR